MARGLKYHAVPIVNHGIASCADLIKSRMMPKQDLIISQKAVTCTHAAKQASNDVRETAQKTIHGIRDYSTRGIHMAAQKFEDQELGTKLVPDPHHRDLLSAAGRVGAASLVSVGIVSETVFDATKSIVQKTLSNV